MTDEHEIVRSLYSAPRLRPREAYDDNAKDIELIERTSKTMSCSVIASKKRKI